MAIAPVSAKEQLSFLRRLAVVYAYPLRLTILAELHKREMSPKEFVREFGGGSVSRVNRHFQRLVEYGWLKLTRTSSGGDRRGAVEHYYRTTELAVFDDETWRQLPYAVRAAFSWRNLMLLGERLRDAIAAGTFDALPDRRLDWKAISLDRLGWERVSTSVNTLFEDLLKEQAGAGQRADRSGERPLRVMVALAAFESPEPSASAVGRQPPGLHLVSGMEPATDWMFRLSKVLADELCLKIVAELSSRPMSVKGFHAEFGGSLPGLYRRFAMLDETGWLHEVEGKMGGRRRGAVERFYQAIHPVGLDSGVSIEVPDAIGKTPGWRTFGELAERVRVAIEAGTLDSREGWHVTWFSLSLDEAGWKAVVAAMDDLLATVREEQERAERSLARSGEPAVPTTIGLAALEVPPEPRAH